MTAIADTASFSPDGVYRYLLTRENLAPDNGEPRTLVVCGLNPSTATAETDDPTIRREKDFAIRWGCTRLVKINAYAFRATKPADMFAAQKRGIDITGGMENERAHAEALDAIRGGVMLKYPILSLKAGILLVAWGANIERERENQLAAIFGDAAMCLRTNADGSPRHPLYELAVTTPIPWRRP